MIIVCYKVHMHKNGLFDGVRSPPTEGGGSLDTLPITILLENLDTRNPKDSLVLSQVVSRQCGAQMTDRDVVR